MARRNLLLVLPSLTLLAAACSDHDATSPPPAEGVTAGHVSRALGETDTHRWLLETILGQWQQAGDAPDASWSFEAAGQAWVDVSSGYQSVDHSDQDGSYEVRTERRSTWNVRLLQSGAPTASWSDADSLEISWILETSRYVVDDLRPLSDPYAFANSGVVRAGLAAGMVSAATGDGTVFGNEVFPEVPEGPLAYDYEVDYKLALRAGGHDWPCDGRELVLTARVMQDGDEKDVYAGTLAAQPGGDYYGGVISSREGEGAWVLNAHRACGETPMP